MTSGPYIAGQWPKRQGEVIRVALDRFKDHDTLDIRVWCENNSGDLRPSKSGITLAVRHLPALANSIEKVLAEAERRGLVGGNQAEAVT